VGPNSRRHGVSPDASTSCGLASVKRVLFTVNKLRPGRSAPATESWVEQIDKKYDKEPVDVAAVGVLFCRLADVLHELQIGKWQHVAPPAPDIPELLISKLSPDVVALGLINTAVRGFPILLHVAWGGTGRHVVVLDTITMVPFADARWGSICDPADGDVYITGIKKGESITYIGGRVTWSMNLRGKPKHNYDQGATIQGVVTNVIHCETPP
jgi:hypothetical protein